MHKLCGGANITYSILTHAKMHFVDRIMHRRSRGAHLRHSTETREYQCGMLQIIPHSANINWQML